MDGGGKDRVEKHWGNEALSSDLNKGERLWPHFQMQLTPLSRTLLPPRPLYHSAPAFADLMAPSAAINLCAINILPGLRFAAQVDEWGYANCKQIRNG